MGYLINNKTKKISLVRGDTLKVRIEILNDGEIYTPQNGDTLRFAMKKDYSSSRVLINKSIPTDTLILHLKPEDTKKLAFGEYVYDIEITFANGDVDTFISGILNLKSEVV